jgi:hypothetical protein
LFPQHTAILVYLTWQYKEMKHSLFYNKKSIKAKIILTDIINRLTFIKKKIDSFYLLGRLSGTFLSNRFGTQEKIPSLNQKSKKDCFLYHDHHSEDHSVAFSEVEGLDSLSVLCHHIPHPDGLLSSAAVLI